MSKTFEEIWCHKEVMGSENANALWRAGQKLAQEADAALAAKDAEVTKLREELEGARKVIEDGIDTIAMHQYPMGESGTMVVNHTEAEQYARRARAFLARKETP